MLILTCSFGFFWLKVIYNRETDQSRGFGFVTMSTVEEAETAVEKFNRYVSSYVYQIISELLACIDGLEGCCSFDIGSLVALSVLNPTKVLVFLL